MSDPQPDAGTEPAPLARQLPVLEYAAPAHRPALRWLAKPVSPEVGLLIWAAASVYVAHLERRHLGVLHFLIGVCLYAAVRVFRWRAALVWKAQVVAAMVVLAIGMQAFLEPWEMWDWSPAYWHVYNQTYRWNYDASLRVAWLPATGLAWAALAVLFGSSDQRRRQRQRHRCETESAPVPVRG